MKKHALLKLLLAALFFCLGDLIVCAAEPDLHRIKELTELAEKSDGPSQLKLALVYDEASNSPMAALWYEKAAGKGYVEAAARLGIMLIKGDGVPQDTSKALKWFRFAAESGDPVAQYHLATCYLSGTGVSRNPAKAAQWGLAAAEQTLPDAEYMMGVLYGRGDGVPHDYVKSFEWVSMAASHGHPQALRSLETLKGTMTAAQITRAKELTDELKTKLSTGNFR